MFKIFKQWMFARRYKRAVKKAVELSKVFDMRFYVICLNGKLRVVSKQAIELLVARRRFRPIWPPASSFRCGPRR